jgi:membrane-associated progesterone receptor component
MASFSEPRLRDYTPNQLRDFDGVSNPHILVALNGDVYDVSSAPEHYGPHGPYHAFAGRNASRALAKMSFDAEVINDQRIDDLSEAELSTLSGWVNKFRVVKRYPIVGKLSNPLQCRDFSQDELSLFKGTEAPREGRVHNEIFIALKGIVFDVSYGGFEMYRDGAGYSMLAGRDASRALGKMSLSAEDLSSSDISDLTPAQLGALDEWVNKFTYTRKYPVVGRLVRL